MRFVTFHFEKQKDRKTNKKNQREFFIYKKKKQQQALGVYGPALKELLHEDFGDGVMSAIDMSMQMEKVDERVQITWNGKFLPYKKP